MSTLHTVNKSPFERNALESCLRLAAPGSAVLLFEDGVVGALRDTRVAPALEAAGQRLELYVLGPDLEARGLDRERLIEGIEVVDYAGFVDLSTTHDRVQAWL